MSVNAIPNLHVAIPATKLTTPETNKPVAQPAPQAQPAGTDSDGDNDGSGVNVKA